MIKITKHEIIVSTIVAIIISGMFLAIEQYFENHRQEYDKTKLKKKFLQQAKKSHFEKSR